MNTLAPQHLWRDGAWHADRAVKLTGDGRLASTLPDAADAAYTARWMLPGVPNTHSHAFQRAMAGLAEHQTRADDSFWTWRETMYGFAATIGPDDLYAIAAQLYVEMLKAGYTSVCEFHYLHHRPDGRAYASPAAMSDALIAAARDTGIGLTLLPTLYVSGGFDGRALSERQRRFGHEVDAYLQLVDALRARQTGQCTVGIALHSLRAVPEAAMRTVLDAARAWGGAVPIHIHIAEQIGEVQDCLAIRNARPVEWLLDHAPVDARWTLVHATHMTPDETARVARSGATVSICPSTEANLGDGLFPLRTYLDAGGRFGIGSDSHISVSPVEELRWLEYGQRLAARRRNIAVTPAQPSVGETLFAHVLDSGAAATGRDIGALDDGRRADLIVLDEHAPHFAARDTTNVLDTWLFAGNTNLVRDVMVGGEWQIRNGRHRDEDAIAARYSEVVTRLAG
ncbi:formimidoylglutamate deiminase [Chiayiivirga flava]|uniref:Formimidoylglutamate deiminase n=1 Tax=Chiayiivirga flava TaxID=659595 RepID=A0A7W8D594_9GAMM|nr:formimidoylglutamate deiminase [Chiayiivirga flava]MBB5207045.1 formimidoylglutamate deiminase [Chiayiivirga flava]